MCYFKIIFKSLNCFNKGGVPRGDGRFQVLSYIFPVCLQLCPYGLGMLSVLSSTALTSHWSLFLAAYCWPVFLRMFFLCALNMVKLFSSSCLICLS